MSSYFERIADDDIGSLSFSDIKDIIEENERLNKRDAVLTALEAAGVDNWEGYEQAMEEAGL